MEGVAESVVMLGQGPGVAADTHCRSCGEQSGISVSQCGRLGALSPREATPSVGSDAFERSWRA